MIRFGVVGTNWITEAFIKAGREVEGFDLTAVYSRTDQRADEFAAKHAAPYAFTHIEKMVTSGHVDAVYIASPNSLHAEQAIQCMNHGKHVICEKPIASNAAELRQMIEAAKRNNVLLMEAMKTTLQPNFEAIRDHLDQIGKVRRYFASYCQYSSRYDAYKNGVVLNAFNPVFSNGSLLDLGIYCVYPLVAMFGRPDDIRANGVMLESGVDGEGSILMKYGDMDAVVMYSKITNSAVPSEIQGEDGNIVVNKINLLDRVEIHRRDGSKEDISREQRDDTMVYEVKHFIDLIREGRMESPVNSYENSLATMEIIDEARKQMGLIYPADCEK